MLGLGTKLQQVALAAPTRGTLPRYIFAVGCVALATAFRYSLNPILADTAPWVLYYPATIGAAWFGGFRAGLFTTLLSAAIGRYLWMAPTLSLGITSSHTALLVGVFLFSGVLTSYLAHLWHRALQGEARAKAELEQRVAERTAKLQESVAELEGFSYTISHDLRAPLRAMNGLSEAVIHDYGDKIGPEGLDYLQRIKSAAERMDALIRDVLAFSRVARAEVRPEPVQTEEIVNEILAEYPQIKTSASRVTVHRPLLPVEASRAPLVQCLANLVTNAVKFVRPGVTPEITIWTEQIDGVVRIHVKDNGIGMKPHLLDKAFQPFIRLHPESSFEGTGIGLAIVKKAAEKMHGRVGGQSEPGKGTTFWVELPAVKNNN